MKEIKLHPYQSKAIRSTKRFVALIAGTGGGKTFFGPWWLAVEIKKYPRDQFFVVAPTYKMLSRATAPELINAYKGTDLEGKYKESKGQYLLPTGGVIWFGSADRPETLEAGQYRAAWLDEAGQMKFQTWVVIQARLGKKMGRCLLTTTPYALNWLYREFYKRWQEGDPDYDVIQFSSVDNPHYPKEEFERAKRTLDSRTFDMRYRGLFRKMAGLVYPDFDQGNIEELPEGKEVTFYAGVDWGYNNPACILVVGEDADFNWWVVEEVYKSGLRIGDLVERAKNLQERFNIQAFYCDPSEPQNIEEFRAHGLNAVAADNAVAAGIEVVAGAIKTKRLKVSKRCPNFLEEIETYHYPEPKEGKEAKEEPEKVDDHAMDAVRYFAISRQKKSPNIWIIE